MVSSSLQHLREENLDGRVIYSERGVLVYKIGKCQGQSMVSCLHMLWEFRKPHQSKLGSLLLSKRGAHWILAFLAVISSYMLYTSS